MLTSTRYPSGHNYSPVDLVKKEYFEDEIIPTEDKQRFKELYSRGEVLWLLDGYDEFVQKIPEQLQDVFHLILKTHHHILTSRPYLIGLPYDVKMEITGFTDENIANYIEQFFDQIKVQVKGASTEGQKLINFLKSNPSIWGVAHIPVNLELICNLWGVIDQSEASILTMTGLYDNMIEWLCQLYLTKQKNFPSSKLDGMFKNDIYEHCKKELVFLETLAFTAMESNRLILQPSSLEKALKHANITLPDEQYIFNIGVLKPFSPKPIDNRSQTKKDYYFVHLSFQEHFAARYLVNALRGSSPQKAIEFIRHNKYNQRFALVFTFVSGLVTANKSCAECRMFWETLLDEPLDLVGFRHIQLIISCIEEATDKSDIPRYPDLIDIVNKWIKCVVVSHNRGTVFTRLFNLLQRSISLAREQRIIDHLIELLNNPNSIMKQNVCVLIYALSTYNTQPQFLLPLMTALDDVNPFVKSYACEALGRMGEQAVTNGVVSKLVSTLGDENDYVRISACEALAEIGRNIATYEVIIKLVGALDDEQESVRKYACDALFKMGERAATNEVIIKLVTTLSDESKYVRSSACYALSSMGEKVVMNEVISKLIRTLGDDNGEVKISAGYALVEMGKKATTNEVIMKMVSTLEDEDENVRGRGCYVLGDMGEKAATHEVISKVVSAMSDESYYVRRNAREALGKMGEKAATHEVISELVSALSDKNENDRRDACEVLGKLGGKAATNEVISKLISTLGNESSYVRRYAREALGKMVEKAATIEVISKLVNALSDENEDVRCGACDVLGKMGEKAATYEVINKLVNTKSDKNEDVRWHACDALFKMGEKAATNEMLSKLVSALSDENKGVRRNACYDLGNIDERAATNEVISKLISTLGDEDKYVRRDACEALFKMGEKAATDEMIGKLVSALSDKNTYVRRGACDVLGKMGAKVATNEVISELLHILNDDSSNRMAAREALKKTFVPFMVMTGLNSDTVAKLLSCIDDNLVKDLAFVPVEALIKVYLHTRNSCWLSVMTPEALLQGNAITVTERTIFVYDNKEPVQLHESNRQLINQLIDAFMEQAVILDLPCTRPKKSFVSVDHREELAPLSEQISKGDVKEKTRSWTCNLL